MALFIADIELVITAAMGWAGDVADFIVANPIALLFVSIPLVGLGIGLIKRLVHQSLILPPVKTGGR